MIKKYIKTGLALLITFLLLAFLALLTKKIYLKPPSFSIKNEEFLGYSKIFKELQEKGFNLKIEASDLENIKFFGEKTLWIIFCPQKKYSLKERQEIKKFVERGGIVIFGSRERPQSLLPQEFEIKVLPHALVEYKNFTKRQDLPILPAKLGKKEYYLLYKFPSPVKAYPKNAKIISQSSILSFVDLDDNGKITPRDERGPFPLALKTKFKKGYFIFFGDCALFSNDLIGKKDNLKFFLSLISSLNPQLIVFDETHNKNISFTKETEFLISLEKVFKNYKFWLFLAFLILAVFFSSKVFLKEKKKKPIEKIPTQYLILAQRILKKCGNNMYTRRWIILMNYQRLKKKILEKLGSEKEIEKDVLLSKLKLNEKEKKQLEKLIDIGERLKRGEKIAFTWSQMVEIIESIEKILQIL